MALWGKSNTADAKPKYLIRGAQNHDPADCFADERGWVLRHYKQQGDKSAAVAAGEYWDEVLVAIGGLGGGGATDPLEEPTITAVFFEQEAIAVADTTTVVVIYDEPVDVTGSPTITVSGSIGGNQSATYLRGTGTNRLEFDITGGTFADTEVISLPGIDIALAGGTIFEAGTTLAAGLAYTNVVGAGGSGDDLTITVTA